MYDRDVKNNDLIIRGNEGASRRNSIVEMFRFLFCTVIINYHFYSHCLQFEDSPNFFARGYLGDEFFFIISGVFLAQSAILTEKEPIDFMVDYVLRRLKKIWVAYYVTWMICFTGRHIIIVQTEGFKASVIIKDIFNSIFELLYFDMFGFREGIYSNVVAWFFSALIICICIIAPWVAKYRKLYALYFAPFFAIFSYGALSISFNYLHSPHELFPGMPVLKGLVRAFAAINMGVFITGLSDFDLIKKLSRKHKTTIVCSLIIPIFIYMVYPFPSNFSEPTVQWDYIVTILIAILIFFIISNPVKEVVAFNRCGVFSFYCFFGQAMFWSIDKVVYATKMTIGCKYIVTIFAVTKSTVILYLLDVITRKGLLKIKT